MGKISDIKAKVVSELLQSRRHLRELEKILKVPKSTLALKLKELQKQNIIDFNQEGRNKKYFLKKTVETELMLKITNFYNIFKLFKQHPHLKPIFQQLQEATDVTMLLFGSYAKETATKTSDIDIFVQTTSKRLQEKLELIHSKLSIKIGDLTKDSLLNKEILQQSIAIQGVDQYTKWMIKNL